MSLPWWVGPVLLASSASLVIALVRLWRQKLRQAPDEDTPVAPQRRDGPPFDTGAPGSGPTLGAAAALKPPPFGLIAPEGVDPITLAWWRKVEGATPLWLMREAHGDWWACWHAAWRRGLPARMTLGDAPDEAAEGSHVPAQGLALSWWGAGSDLVPSLARDAALWRELRLVGLPITLERTPDGVGLRVPGARIRDHFDLGCLAALAALLEARVGDAVAPDASAHATQVAAVALATADRVIGDLPPFGALHPTESPDTWRFEGRCARTLGGPDDGALRDVWPHHVTVQVVGAHAEGVSVTLSDGEAALVRALDRRPGRLQSALGVAPVDL